MRGFHTIDNSQYINRVIENDSEIVVDLDRSILDKPIAFCCLVQQVLKIAEPNAVKFGFRPPARLVGENDG